MVLSVQGKNERDKYQVLFEKRQNAKEGQGTRPEKNPRNDRSGCRPRHPVSEIPISLKSQRVDFPSSSRLSLGALCVLSENSSSNVEILCHAKV